MHYLQVMSTTFNVDIVILYLATGTWVVSARQSLICNNTYCLLWITLTYIKCYELIAYVYRNTCLFYSFSLLFYFSKQLTNSWLNITHFARHLGFIFDEHLTFTDQISFVSKSCYYHICQLHCICPYLDPKTATTTAIFIDNSKLDYCNSVYHNLPKFQIIRLQVTCTCCGQSLQVLSYHSHILHSLHWLRIIERIE